MRQQPDVDAVEVCAFPGFERKAKEGALAPYRLLSKVAGELRGRFDTAVVLRFDHWWGAWLAAAAGIPTRIGYAWPETRPFLTRRTPISPRPARSAAECRLAGGAGARHGSSAWDRRSTQCSQKTGHGLRSGWGRFAGRWWPSIPARAPPSNNGRSRTGLRWRRRLAETKAASVVLTGGPGERDLTAGVAAEHGGRPALDLAGQTTLGQLAAVYERCDLVLGSDSGPLHLAVAVGAPTVHLYGPVPAAKFGPWGNPARQCRAQVAVGLCAVRPAGLAGLQHCRCMAAWPASCRDWSSTLRSSCSPDECSKTRSQP